MYKLLLGEGVDRNTHANAIAEIEKKFDQVAAGSTSSALIILPHMVKKYSQTACAEANSGQIFGQEYTLYYFMVDYYSDFGAMVFQDVFGHGLHRFSLNNGYQRFSSPEEMRAALD